MRVSSEHTAPGRRTSAHRARRLREDFDVEKDVGNIPPAPTLHAYDLRDTHGLRCACISDRHENPLGGMLQIAYYCEEIYMRKIIMMALAGFLWRKFSERGGKPARTSGAMRRW